MKPRLGFLGAGWIGRHRLQAVVEAGSAEVVAIADPVGENTKAAALLAPAAQCCTSLEELLAAEVDGIVIATPSALHAAQAIRALEAGHAVFCQKPLARNFGEVDAVLAAAQKADRLLGVDLSYRHTRALQAVRKSVQQGELGRISFVNLVFHNAYGPDKPWFYRKDLAGGGCVMDLAVHLIDAAVWMLGEEPEVLSSLLLSGGRSLVGQAVEDIASISLRFPSGAAGQLACSWNLHAGKPAHIEASFYGTNGGASFINIGGSFFDFQAELFLGTVSQQLIAPPDAWGGGAILQWVNDLAANGHYRPEIESYRSVARVTDAIYSCAAFSARL